VIALAYLLHGVFLLTSIGIGIEKKARYYPIVTGAAAAVNLALNFALIPRYGMMGAAWATVAAYAVMAGLGGTLSQRLYPIPFERARLLAIVVAAAAVMALVPLAPPAMAPRLAFKCGLLALFPIALFAAGVLRRPHGGAAGRH